MKWKKVIGILLMFFFGITSCLATEVLSTGQGSETREAEKDTPVKIIATTFSENDVEPFTIIGNKVEAGTRKRILWYSLQSLLGKKSEIPVIVINGAHPGPVLTLTAAIHGDELNGIEIVRQIVNELDPQEIKGVVVGIPIVNLEGFWRKERYLGGRKDLNRYFPGSPNGSYPSRVANHVFTGIIQHTDIVIDIHTGSFYRENLPQLRVDLNIDEVSKLATGFGAITALHNVAPKGSLREAATAVGIPAIVMEVGGPLSLEVDKVEVGVKSIRSFMQSIGMIDKKTFWPNPQPLFYASQWLRAEAGGILINKVALGSKVKKGDVLAEITNPLVDSVYSVVSPMDGTILGRAQNQFVSPGYALFHIGHKKSVEEIEKDVEQHEKSVEEEPVDVEGES